MIPADGSRRSTGPVSRKLPCHPALGTLVQLPRARRTAVIANRVLFRGRRGGVVEDLTQLVCKGLGLTGVAELAAEEAAVVAWEHGRLLSEPLGGGDRSAPGEGVQRLLTHGYHDARGRRGQSVEVRAI